MKKRKIVALLSIVITTLIASTSLSVAWYTNSSFLVIDGFQVSLNSGGDGLLISTENKSESFKEHIDFEDLNDSGLFKPVSSMFSSLWADDPSVSNPIFYEEYNASKVQLVEEGGVKYAKPFEDKAYDGYFSQELFLKTERDFYVTLDLEETFVKNNENSNWAYAGDLAGGDLYGKSQYDYYQELNSLINSLRISILIDTPAKRDYKIIAPYKNDGEVTYLGGLLDTGLTGTYDCVGFEDESYEILYGEVTNREKVIYYDQPQPIGYSGSLTWFNSSHNPSAKQINLEGSKNNGLSIAKEDALSLEEINILKTKTLDRTATKDEISQLILIPCKANVASRIVLSIYFEGWDEDNLNKTMGGSFDMNLSFDCLDTHIAD